LECHRLSFSFTRPLSVARIHLERGGPATERPALRLPLQSNAGAKRSRGLEDDPRKKRSEPPEPEFWLAEGLETWGPRGQLLRDPYPPHRHRDQTPPRNASSGMHITVFSVLRWIALGAIPGLVVYWFAGLVISRVTGLEQWNLLVTILSLVAWAIGVVLAARLEKRLLK